MKSRGFAPTGLAAVAIGLVSAGCSAAVSVLAIRAFRYPDWVVISRYAAESTALTLPALTIVTALVVRRVLAPGLPWLLPQLPRTARLAQGTVLALATSAVVGDVIGLFPLLIWGLDGARGGGFSLLGLLGSLAWVATAVIIAALVTVVSRSLWPGLVLALILLAIFYLGFTSDPSYGQFTTHVGVLPFDGNLISFGSGGVTINPRLELIRLAAALLLGAAALAGTGRPFTAPTTAARYRSVLATPVTAVLAAAIVGSAIPAVAVTAARHQQLRCQSAVGVQVCLTASHVDDLPAVVAVVSRVYPAAGDRLLPQRLIVEEPDAARVDPTRIQLSLSAESGIDPRADAAEQISYRIVHFDACVNDEGRTSEDLQTAAEVADWYAHLAGSNRTTSAASGSLIKKWSAHPRTVNAAFQAHASGIATCTLTSAQLP